MKNETITAAILIIGNEILSGRTQDTNIKHIAEKLAGRGIGLTEVRVVPDERARIVGAVNTLRAQAGYLFTTGGIGPTHDDITAEAVAASFGVKLARNEEAYQILVRHYGAEADVTPPRAKMAMLPEGAALIHNPVSGAPGFSIENVYVMAGVPKIMQGMLDNVLPQLGQGPRVLVNTLVCALAESLIAEPMADVQARFPDVSIGSYPHFRPGAPSLSLVLRSADGDKLRAATAELAKIIGAQDAHMTMDLQVALSPSL